eukprot:269138-Chlamydomonas_euryale.AAC.1
MGVCKALFENHMLPRVLAGSSAGAVVCGIVATRTDAELSALFERVEEFDMTFFAHSGVLAMARQILRKGSLQDMAHMVRKLRQLYGDLTFLEAYERSGRILN